jgi:hypothetical protein
MADRTPVPRDPEDERADLMATLAAARELGPEMDTSIADSYLERRKSEARAGVVPSASAGSQAQGSQPGQGIMPHQTPGTPSGIAQAGMLLFPLIGIAIFAVILFHFGWSAWWLFWIPMAMGGWWRGMWYPHNRYAYRAERHAMRDEYRQARRDARYRYRYDYHYDYGNRRDDDRRRDDDLD